MQNIKINVARMIPKEATNSHVAANADFISSGKNPKQDPVFSQNYLWSVKKGKTRLGKFFSLWLKNKIIRN